MDQNASGFLGMFISSCAPPLDAGVFLAAVAARSSLLV